MKRSLIFCLAVLLTAGSVSLAKEFDQDRNDRPRRATRSNSGFLGVNLNEVTKDVVGRLKLREERGALITSVTTDSAASKAGLQKDDVIIKWNGETVESASHLWRHIHETPAGRSVKLGVMRDGREIELNATMGDRGEYMSRYLEERTIARDQIREQTREARERARQASEQIRERSREAREQARERSREVREQAREQAREVRQAVARSRDWRGYRMGISLQGMSPQLAEYFGLKNRNGALVVFVHPDSAAAKAGIKAGDVILSLGGETVESPYKVHQVLRSRPEGSIEVRVMRDRQERTFTLQLEKAEPNSFFISPDDFDGGGEILVEVPMIDLEPLEIEIPPMAPVAPMPRLAVPAIRIAPITVAPMSAIAPMVPMAPIKIAPIEIAPVAIPEIHFTPVRPPKISIPPLKLIMPRLVFINPV